jgi:hypothetical protein
LAPQGQKRGGGGAAAVDEGSGAVDRDPRLAEETSVLTPNSEELMIGPIKTVSVYVEDQQKAVDFYTRKLGFEIRRRV